MNNNDLSDEAKEGWTRMAWETSKNESKESEILIQAAQIGWQECRRRAEAIMRLKDKEIEVMGKITDNVKHLLEEREIQNQKDWSTVLDQIKKDHQTELEQRERKAFEFAFIRANDWCDGLAGWKQSEINAAWYAYKEQQKP